jgi:hypothetical protein
MSRLVPSCVLLVLLAIGGCGGGGLSKDELAKSVLEASKVYVAEGSEEAHSVLEEAADELRNEAIAEGSGEARSALESGAEKLEAVPGPYEFHIRENACQDPQSATPAPTGEKALYQCFIHYGPIGADEAEEVELVFSIYSVSGQCWKGVLINLDSGLGTPDYYEVPTSQEDIDRGKGVDLNGCIGDAPSTAFIAEPGKPARIEPERVEISLGSQPLIVNDIQWQNWGARTARGMGTLEANSCKPSCASGNYESQGSIRVYLAAAEGECGRVLYRRVKLVSSAGFDGSFELSCTGLAQPLDG